MAFRGKRKANDKYLRLTGLWPSKNNDSLWTGRMKPDQLEELIKRVEEALDADAPIVFGLWANDKKESRKDPEFSLQCFVGDTEELPRSSRSSRHSNTSSRRSSRDNDKETEETEEEEVEESNEEPEEEEAETPKRRGKKAVIKKRSSSW